MLHVPELPLLYPPRARSAMDCRFNEGNDRCLKGAFAIGKAVGPCIQRDRGNTRQRSPGKGWNTGMRQGFPIATRGMKIGLLGGSFDPAHEGHVHITREALRRFGLDRVWWLVSPGNPLKRRQPAPMAQRLAQARSIMRHPRVMITDLEVHLGTRYTAQTIRKLRALYPGVRFVWLMGADNLVQFHRWEQWEEIMRMTPIGVLARPGWGVKGRMGRAARVYATDRVTEGAAGDLGDIAPPAWVLADVPLNDLSSTAIRAKGEWGKDGTGSTGR